MNNQDKHNVYIVRNPLRLLYADFAKQQIIYNQEVMTSISKEDVEYFHKLVHKELDNQGIWDIQEENAMELVDLLYSYFFE